MLGWICKNPNLSMLVFHSYVTITFFLSESSLSWMFRSVDADTCLVIMRSKSSCDISMYRIFWPLYLCTKRQCYYFVLGAWLEQFGVAVTSSIPLAKSVSAHILAAPFLSAQCSRMFAPEFSCLSFPPSATAPPSQNVEDWFVTC